MYLIATPEWRYKDAMWMSAQSFEDHNPKFISNEPRAKSRLFGLIPPAFPFEEPESIR
jgi:hypothetical protein